MNHSALIRGMVLMLLIHSTDAKMELVTYKQDVPVGGDIILVCLAGGEGNITWQKDGKEISDEANVTKIDEATSRLIIKNVALEDVGRYTCLCDFDNGHADKIMIQIDTYDLSFIRISRYHEFLEGTDGVIPCWVNGRPAVDVTWLKNDQAIPPEEGSRVRQLPDNTLLIKNVKREDAGTYHCKAQIRGSPINNLYPISVVVNAPPTVDLRGEKTKVFAGPDTNVSLLCLVDGLPKPNIKWIMPTVIDSSHHHFNSDSSQLTIKPVARADDGEYVCIATNKIAQSSATIMLHVVEAPKVFVSAEQQSVSVGLVVSVSCNVSGHPQPQLHWLNKHNGQILDSTSGRVHVVDSTLVIEEVMPSDGGLYSCMAVSNSGNASRDVAIHTEPGPPHYLSVSPGPASVLFSLKIPPISGGTPITHYVLQWRQNADEHWKEVMVPASDNLTITDLEEYTKYTVRLAALNAVGVGQFSDTNTVRTLGLREPDRPVLLVGKMKVERDSFSVPLSDDGGDPLKHFNVRYRQDKEGAEWKEIQLSSSSDFISLKELSFGSGYEVQVRAVDDKGSSLPATTGEQHQPVRGHSRTTGNMIGILIVISLVVFLVVDATCCYRNRCGLLMSIAVKLGYKVPGLKKIEDVEEATIEQVRLIRVSPRRGGAAAGAQTKDGGQFTEETDQNHEETMETQMSYSEGVFNEFWRSDANATQGNYSQVETCTVLRPEGQKTGETRNKIQQ